ncbi:glycosyltransferase, partial [Frankia sp. EI5c]|uniref:glycosyltransferase n=1 Tax=Frankia sp. EI5c TaxID=683316 RepID=UPI0026F473C2
MRRPRIALLCGNLTPERDGVADYTVRLARALAVSADVVLLAGEPGGLGGLGGPGGPGGPGGLTARGGPGGCEVVDLGGTGWGPRRLEAAARALRALSPDVVHVQFAPSAFGFSPMVGLLPALPSGRAR